MRNGFLAFLGLMIATQVFAWGVTGHRATGLIAERYLTKKAKKKLALLLGDESLPMITTWMDEIRSDSTYNRIHPDWHWVTIPDGQTYAEAQKNPNGDNIATIMRIVSELKTGGLSRQTELEYVKIMAHLVGDLHQPLHVGTGNDQGGNQVRVKWFREESNLHRVWDSDMIDGTRLSYTELAISVPKPDKTKVAKWQSGSVAEWAMESAGLRPQVYDIGNGNLGYRYSYKNLPIVRQRILQAGVRLAGLLNEIYG